MDREERRPAAVEDARRCFVGVLHAVAIPVRAVEEIARDSADEEQLIDAVDRPILGAIGRIERRVVIASGAAVQNMNVMMGFEESAGLEVPPIFP